jgi:hypothetical protein
LKIKFNKGVAEKFLLIARWGKGRLKNALEDKYSDYEIGDHSGSYIVSHDTDAASKGLKKI